jgi:hypothetical protein
MGSIGGRGVFCVRGPAPGIHRARPRAARATNRERTLMKLKLFVPVLALLAVSLFLTGCPGKDKMMSDDGMTKEESMMEKN